MIREPPISVAPLNDAADAAWLEQLDAVLRAARPALVSVGEHLAPVRERLLDAAGDAERILCAASSSGRAIGIVDAALHAPAPGDLTISQLAVARAHRFRGVGRALIGAALREADARGDIERIHAAVKTSVPEALTFWLALGFEIVAQDAGVQSLVRAP